jgi:hypothetical protein|nr:MAG TPA: hypothetical protein [Caudoviricetes sp.]
MNNNFERLGFMPSLFFIKDGDERWQWTQMYGY